jgi:hypothetical protein
MTAIWMGWGVLALFSVITVIVPSWTWILSSWQFESPEAMEPSPRRWRIVRANSAIVLVGLLAYLVGNVWPGDGTVKAAAGLVTIFVGFALVIVGLVLERILRRRTPQGDDGTPPNELSEAGYAVEYLSIAVGAAAVLIIGFIVAGVANDSAQRTEENSLEAHQQEVDEAQGRFNDLSPQLTVLDAAPASGGVALPIEYAVLDADERDPRLLWELATVVGGGSNDGVLADADLAVGSIGFSCDATALIVIETETTVSIGIAVSNTAPADGTLNCTPLGGSSVTSWFPIDLAAPVGDRDVLNLDGRRMLAYVADESLGS